MVGVGFHARECARLCALLAMDVVLSGARRCAPRVMFDAVLSGARRCGLLPILVLVMGLVGGIRRRDAMCLTHRRMNCSCHRNRKTY